MGTRKHLLLLCGIFVLLWSSGWIGSKYALGFSGTFTLLMYRYLVVSVALALLVTYTGSWKRVPRKELVTHSFIGILAHAYFLSTSLEAIHLGVSAGMIAFIAALQPMATAVVSSPVTSEGVHTRHWTGLTLGLCAVLLVVGDRMALGGSGLAYLLAIVSVVAISFSSLLARRQEMAFRARARTPTPILLITFIHCFSSFLVLLPLAGIVEQYEVIWSYSYLFSILWLALVVSLGAYGIYFLLLRYMPAFKVSCLIYLTPPSTMLLGFLVFGEVLTLIDLIALVIAAVSVWVVTVGKIPHVRLPRRYTAHRHSHRHLRRRVNMKHLGY